MPASSARRQKINCCEKKISLLQRKSPAEVFSGMVTLNDLIQVQSQWSQLFVCVSVILAVR